LISGSTTLGAWARIDGPGLREGLPGREILPLRGAALPGREMVGICGTVLDRRETLLLEGRDRLALLLGERVTLDLLLDGREALDLVLTLLGDLLSRDGDLLSLELGDLARILELLLLALGELISSSIGGISIGSVLLVSMTLIL